MIKVSPSDCNHVGGENGRICETKLSSKSTLTGGGPTSCYMSTQSTPIKRLGSRVDGRPATTVTGVSTTNCKEKLEELDEFSRRDADDNEGSDYFKECKDDPFNRRFWGTPLEDGLTPIIMACVIFAGGVTISLIVHIYFVGLSVFEVVGPVGLVLSDSQVCASLGLEVFMDGGSSVDAAITAALCQGIVHPHTSGIGGGGVMLVHDRHTGKHTVIDFGETAPSRIKEDMLQHDLQEKPGLLVGVPGLLRGLHEAHQLYGRMQWGKIVRRAASIAREGFNVSRSLAEAIESHRGKNESKLFREIFSPEEDEHHPAPSTLMRLPRLAMVLERIASHGMEAFYQGNVSEEIAVTVQAHGGVLSRADLANYSAVLQEPLTGTFKGHQVFVPPPPSTAGALLTFLNIMDGIKLTGKIGEDSASHWIVESLTAALLMAPGIADPKFVSSVSDTISKMTSKTHAAALRQMIRNSSSEPLLLHRHVSALRSLPEGARTSSQVLVMGADDLIVSLSCSLNGLFGSGVVTPSGILLNSQIMNFSWRKGTLNATWSDQPNRIEAGKRARSWHVPTIVRQTGGRCSQTLVLGAAAGQQALSGMAQVLIKLLSLQKNLSDSVSEGRLHPSMQTNVTLVDSEFSEQQVRALRQRGHVVGRVGQLCLVSVVERRGDVMRGCPDPRNPEAAAQGFARPQVELSER